MRLPALGPLSVRYAAPRFQLRVHTHTHIHRYAAPRFFNSAFSGLATRLHAAGDLQPLRIACAGDLFVTVPPRIPIAGSKCRHSAMLL